MKDLVKMAVIGKDVRLGIHQSGDQFGGLGAVAVGQQGFADEVVPGQVYGRFPFLAMFL